MMGLSRMKARSEKKNGISVMGVALLIMYLISGILLLLLATLLYRFELNVGTVKVGIVAIYIISGFVGGFLIGKQMQDKKYLWGLLTGGTYFILLFILSLFLKKGMGGEITFDAVRILTTMALCAVSSMAGGMVS